jgi:hypothetical protein
VSWVAHDIRDEVVDFIRHWTGRTELPAKQLLGWIGLSPRQYHRWQDRFGKVNEHNHLVPRDHWLETWEKEAIVDFCREYPSEGHRRLTFMMLDRNIMAVSAASVYRVLKQAGLIQGLWQKPSKRARALCNRSNGTSTGTLTSPTSISPARSIICAASWTEPAATSSSGTSARR